VSTFGGNGSGQDGQGPGGRGFVLVVDEKPTIADVVARHLHHAGYRVRTAGDGIRAIELASEERPDLVVLDLMLPRLNGLEVMRRLRAGGNGGPLPVILLAAKREARDRVVGLRLGADDYVVKPFSPAELVARVDAVLRRVGRQPEREEPITYGDIELDPVGRRVTVGDEEVPLSVREYDLLLHFMRHPGQVFSRNQLLDAVWRVGPYIDTSTVTVHVRRVRAKLEQDPSRPRWLQTVWGVGYRFQPVH
jgi:DNA-binding response OmpR family regulator